MTIDLNADVGEGMEDEHLLPYLTSANVACGLHAGDPSVMDETVALAMVHGVHVGAHPGYPDPGNFGRLRMEMPADAVKALPDAHVEGQINLDMNYWAEHRDEIATRWYAWQTK